MSNPPHLHPGLAVMVEQGDYARALEWEFILNHRDSEYEGDAVADLALDFAKHREGLRSALALARNRLRAAAVNAVASGDPHHFEYSEWADEAQAALADCPKGEAA